MSQLRVARAWIVAAIFALAAAVCVPIGFEAETLLASEDDPAAIADRALAKSFDRSVAIREIESALAAGDADLARSFLELARERDVLVDPALVEKVALANAGVATAKRSLGSFARGLIVGEAEDVSGFAGTAVGDLFVLGDVRDVVREGARLAAGGEADELVLGLACVGLAVTAATYATLGVGVPARVGLTAIKAARQTGRLGAGMAAWIGHSLREVIDWTVLKRAVSRAAVAEPAAAARGIREAVRVEKAQSLVRFVGDVGRVQASAGARAAIDGLRLAEGSRDMSKVARLAAAKSGKTRAILKLAGRGAIVLAVGAFDLATWLFWALLTLFAFLSSLKRATERRARYARSSTLQGAHGADCAVAAGSVW